MEARDPDVRSSNRGHSFPTLVAALAGTAFVALGIWAMADPRSFFEAVATFDPYNEHFLQDIGAFQIGLGAVLLLAAARMNGLATALLGTGVGAAMHTGSHIVGRHLGGDPQTDIPTFAILALILVTAGAIALRRPSKR